MVVQPQMRPQAYTATLPQAPQYNAAPKKKSLIRIVDPKSNQDITDTIIRKASMTTTGSSSPHSGQSSASGTPPAVSRFSLTVAYFILVKTLIFLVWLSEWQSFENIFDCHL